jgi:hypothetical protein
MDYQQQVGSLLGVVSPLNVMDHAIFAIGWDVQIESKINRQEAQQDHFRSFEKAVAI